jgi:hypothetical protein
VQHFIGDGAHHGTAQCAVATRTHHDEVAGKSLSNLHNGMRRVALCDFTFVLNARRIQKGLRAFEGVQPPPLRSPD